MLSQKTIIGTNAKIAILGRSDVPAKIDTGADSSAIWASDIKITRDNVLKFKLFGPGSPFYTGKVVKRTDFSVANITSSNGQSNIRYRTHFTIKVEGRTLRIRFSLADRSGNTFPILIGRRALRNKFIVDVSKYHIHPLKDKADLALNEKMRKNPRQFYLKHKRGKIVL